MIESVILGRLINDKAYLSKVVPYLKEDYFQDEGQRELFKLISEFSNRYNAAPTVEALAVMLTEKNMNERLYESAISALEGASYDEATDAGWLVVETETWARNQAVERAVMRAIGILDAEKTGNKNKDEMLDKNGIPSLLQEALGVSFSSSSGHDYFRDAEKQYDEFYAADDVRIPFSVETLNRVTKGGVRHKTLNLIFAGINVGKSTFLIQQAADYLAAGKNVVYFTMEMEEPVVRERIDVCLHDTTFDGLHALTRQQYLNRIAALQAKTQGKLKIKEFPSGVPHAGHFRHYLRELKMKEGFEPDLIVVDYLTICASGRLRPDARSNSNTYFTSVAEELRALGQEFGAPVWSACQFDRAGQDASDVKMENTGLAIGIQATADFSLALMMPEDIASENKCIGKILKSRYNNKSKVKKFLLGLDNDRQRYFDLDDNEQSAIMDPEEKEAYSNGSKPVMGAGSKPSDWKF